MINLKLERTAYWSKHIQAQKEQNQSVALYCQKQGLKVKTFYRWRAALAQKKSLQKGKAACRKPPRAQNLFVPVQIVPSSAPSVCKNPLQIDMDPQWVAELIIQLHKKANNR